jgi:hypothetical protein
MRWVVLFAAALVPGLAEAGPLINEILPDPLGSDLGYEWLEIANDGALAVDLSGWQVERATTAAYSLKYTFPAGVMLAPGDHVVVGEEFVTGADFNLAPGIYLSLGNAALDGDAVRLCDDNGATIDTVVYGPNNANGFADDTGGVALAAPRGAEDESIARMPDATDTDDSSVDFVIDATPTVGLDNGSAPPMVITSASPGLAGQANTWDLTEAPASCTITWFASGTLGSQAAGGGACPGIELGVVGPKLLGSGPSDAMGEAQFVRSMPAGLAGRTVHVQAYADCACVVSNVTTTAFP